MSSLLFFESGLTDLRAWAKSPRHTQTTKKNKKRQKTFRVTLISFYVCSCAAVSFFCARPFYVVCVSFRTAFFALHVKNKNLSD
jgi:hypothetical protein